MIKYALTKAHRCVKIPLVRARCPTLCKKEPAMQDRMSVDGFLAITNAPQLKQRKGLENLRAQRSQKRRKALQHLTFSALRQQHKSTFLKEFLKIFQNESPETPYVLRVFGTFCLTKIARNKGEIKQKTIKCGTRQKEKSLKNVVFSRLFMAERKGFEPLWGCPQTVFKTASL